MEGIRDGTPIALGYLVVAFTLGIAARNAGLTAFAGFLASFFNLASAGEYAGFTVIAAGGTLLELALMTLVANARYLLMTCVISQKFAPDTGIIHRILVAYATSDEIFGITIAKKGALNPYYNYGAMSVAIPAWSIGTALGIIAGNLLSAAAVSALSVALFGMFIWVIIPPARDNRIIGVLVAISFLASFACANLPVISDLSGGTRTIILTIAIAAIGAILHPIKDNA